MHELNGTCVIQNCLTLWVHPKCSLSFEWAQFWAQRKKCGPRAAERIAPNRCRFCGLSGERGRNRTFNLLIKSQPVLHLRFTRNYPINQQLTTSLARTEETLEVLKTLAMLSNVQPHLQPHP